jgi:hypothetical protein
MEATPLDTINKLNQKHKDKQWKESIGICLS